MGPWNYRATASTDAHKHTKGGPQAVINGVITPFSRVMTPLTYPFVSVIYGGYFTQFKSFVGDHLVPNMLGTVMTLQHSKQFDSFLSSFSTPLRRWRMVYPSIMWVGEAQNQKTECSEKVVFVRHPKPPPDKIWLDPQTYQSKTSPGCRVDVVYVMVKFTNVMDGDLSGPTPLSVSVSSQGPYKWSDKSCINSRRYSGFLWGYFTGIIQGGPLRSL